jgi:hypothetical protein
MGKRVLIVLSFIFVSLVMFLVINSHNNLSSRDNTATMMSSDGPATFDDKLARYDAALDHMINTCSKDIYPDVKERCINDIEEAWWIECAEHYDKLDTCKNGKVENYLKNEGIST